MLPSPQPIYTIGHSTHPLPELLDFLRAWKIQTLADVRAIPRSRTNPQFNQDTFPGALAAEGINYIHFPALGGRRSARKSYTPSRNTGWQVGAFLNYADYALTPPFQQALEELITLSQVSTVAIMCSEAVWWRCHRRIVSDYLLARSIPVFHIMSVGDAPPATLTPFACPQPDATVLYPDQPTPELPFEKP